MSVITDVPDSGLYIQWGSVIQLVVQFMDNNTGLPVQLQTATAMSISILYPDGSTIRTFSASLYTDGSDGKIVYTTVNNGINLVDLNQVGLYKVQGYASIGGLQFPPSSETDFYVQPNVQQQGGAMPAGNPTALIELDSNNIRWALTVDTNGGLHWAATPSGPPIALIFNHVVLKDATGVYWTYTISTLGVPVATQGGIFAQAINFFVLYDANGRGWVITAATGDGHMVAS